MSEITTSSPVSQSSPPPGSPGSSGVAPKPTEEATQPSIQLGQLLGHGGQLGQLAQLNGQLSRQLDRQGERIGSVPRDLQSQWQADSQAMLDEAAAREPAEAAVLGYAAARILEERLHDPARALDALLRAAYVPAVAGSAAPSRGATGGFVPALRALRWHALSTGSYLTAIELIDREIVASTVPAARAALMVEKAYIWHDRLQAQTRAREVIEEALRVQPGNRMALVAALGMAEREGDVALLRSALEQWLGSSSSSIERGRILTRLALMSEGDPARQSDALALFGRSLEEDPTGDAAGVARAGLRRLGTRLGRDVELMRGLAWEADQAPAGLWRAAWRTMLAAFSRYRLGESERASANVEAALADCPDDLGLLEQAVEQKISAGQWRGALELVEHEAELVKDPPLGASVRRTAAFLAEVRLQDDARAAEHLRAVLKAEPSDGAALAALERISARRGDAQVQAELASAAAGRAEDPEVRAALALRAAEIHETALHDLNSAVTMAHRALESVPGYGPAVIVLERLYAELGRWDDLLKVIEADDAAAVLEPVSPATSDHDDRVARRLERLGTIHEERLADPERAMSLYREWVALGVRPRAAQSALARAAEKAGDALVAAEAAMALGGERCGLEPSARVAWLYRAAVLFEERAAADGEAVRAYEAALALAPGFRPALEGLARIHHRRKDIPALVDSLQRIVALGAHRSCPEALELARLQAELLGQPERALETLTRAQQRDPSHVGVGHYRVLMMTRVGRIDELAPVLGDLADRISDPKARAAMLRWQAELLEWRLKRPREALVAVERALGLCGGAPDLASELMQERLIQQLGRHSDVAALQLRRIESATSATADAATLTDRRIDLAMRLPDGERAVAMLNRVLDESPDHTFALEILVGILRRLGRERELQAALERLARGALDVEVRGAMWRAAAAARERGGERDPDSLAFHAWLLEQRPAPREAVAALERLAAARGDLPRLIQARTLIVEQACDEQLRAVALWELALAEVAANELARACASLERAVSCWPELVPAVRELAMLREHLRESRSAAELYARLAAMCRNPLRAAEALRCAARVHLEQLGDPDEAVACLERAVALDPAAERDFEVIESVLRPRDDIDRIAAVLRRRAAVGSRVDRRNRLMHLAELLQQKDARSEAALDAIAAAVDLDPSHAPALLRMAEQLTTLERYPEAVSAYRRAIAATSDSDVLRRAWLAVGAIEGNSLDNPAAAAAAFSNALVIAPNDSTALAGLANVLVRRSDFDGAAEALERLIAVEAEPGVRLRHTLALGRLLADSCADPEGAVGAFEQALSIDPTNDEAMTRLDELLTELDDPARLAAVIARFVQALEEAGAAPRPASQAAERKRVARALERRLRLATILAGPLQSPTRAAEELRIVLEARPDSLAARSELARALEGAGRVHEAISEHLLLMRQDPLRVESLRRLVVLFGRAGDQERAQRAAAVLVALGFADPVEERAVRRTRAGAVPEPKGSLTDAELELLVRHPDERHPMTAVLAALDEALARIYPGNLERWGLGKSDRLSGRSDDPLRNMVQRISTLLGISEPFEVYVAAAGVKAVELELTEPPSLIASGTLLAAAPAREAYLHLGSRLGRLRAGTYSALRVATPDLEIVLAAAIRLIAPDYGRGLAPEPVLTEMSQRIGRAMSRKKRRALDEAVTQLAAAPPLNFARWLAALEHTGHRAALLVSDDLLGAFDQIVRSDRKLAAAAARPEDLRAAARNSTDLIELIAFALGDDLASLRARLT